MRLVNSAIWTSAEPVSVGWSRCLSITAARSASARAIRYVLLLAGLCHTASSAICRRASPRVSYQICYLWTEQYRTSAGLLPCCPLAGRRLTEDSALDHFATCTRV